MILLYSYILKLKQKNKFLLLNIKEPGLVQLVNKYSQHFIYEDIKTLIIDIFNENYTFDNGVLVYKIYKILKENNLDFCINILKTDIKIFWCKVSGYQYLSNDFIKDFQDFLDWREISEYQQLNYDMISLFSDKINWFYISQYQVLSEKIMKKFRNKLDWSQISKHQKLSESFILRYHKFLDWEYITKFQKLSPNIVHRFKHKIYWNYFKDAENYNDNYIQSVLSFHINTLNRYDKLDIINYILRNKEQNF